MATVQNQTNPFDFQNISPEHPGSGIFAVPDPSSDQIGAFKKLVFDGITYESCIRRGAFCMAFKWVPRAVADRPCSTPGAPCVTACADDNCLCIDGRCL